MAVESGTEPGAEIDGATAPHVDADNPWPGLTSFTEAAQDFFHGRDAEVAELARHIRRDLLTVLFGQSGLGKTSLLSAGLFPRLRAADFLPVYLRLDLNNATVPPVAQIKQALARAMAEAAIDGPAPAAEATLWGYFHDKETELWSPRNRLVTPVLVLDQFEEIFTLGRNLAAVDALVTELSDLVGNRPPETVRAALDTDPDGAARYDFAADSCRVVIALREDFLPELEGLRRRMPAVMENRMRLTRMDGRQARDVILKSGGALVAPAVAERIIAFVAGARPAADPADPADPAAPGDAELARLEIEPALLSIVCRELNNKRREAGHPQITSDLLDGAQNEIVASFYESSLADLDPAVKAFVEEQLLTASGYRDSRPLADALLVPGVTREAIDLLVGRRLLRIEDRFGTQWVELTHDLLTQIIRRQRDRRREQTREASEAEARAQAERERAERAEEAAREAEAEREAQQALAAAAHERERAAHRLVRRTRLALAVTAIMLAVALAAVVFAAYQRQIAEARAEDAARSYALALDAARRNIEIVDHDYKTGGINTAVARALLDAARSTFSGLPSDREDVAATRLRIGLFGQLAQTYRSFGDIGAAGGAAETEHALAETLAASGPQGQRDLAESAHQLGAAMQGRGDLDGAMKEYGQRLAILSGLAARNSADGDLQRTVSDAHQDVGDVHMSRGDLGGALAAYRASRGILTALAAKDPAKPGWQEDLATSDDKIGDVLRAQGNLAGGLKEYQDGLAIRLQLTTQDPTNAGWQRDLAVSHNRIGIVHQTQGDLAGAMGEFNAELVIATRLAQKDPGNALWQRELSVSHNWIGAILLAQGDLDGALREFTAERDGAARLAAQDPANAGWEGDLATADSRVGDILHVRGDLIGAAREYGDGLTVLKRLAAQEPTNAAWQRPLAIAHLKLGDVLQTQGNSAGALAEFRAGAAIYTALAAQDPDNSSWRRELALSHSRIGDALQAQGDLAAALIEFRQDLAESERLAGRDATNTEWQTDLAVAHDRIGGALEMQQDLPGALHEFQAESAIDARLAAKDPDNANWQRELAVSHIQIGGVERLQGDLAAALGEFKIAAGMLAPLVAKVPGNLGWQYDLAASHSGAGSVLEAQGERDAAHYEYAACAAIVAAVPKGAVSPELTMLADFCGPRSAATETGAAKPPL